MMMRSKNLFIDTSIFVQENFLEGTRINTILYPAAQGQIRIFLSEITLNEIKVQFKRRATIAFDKLCEFINDKVNRLSINVLRNNAEGKNIIKRLQASSQYVKNLIRPLTLG